MRDYFFVFFIGLISSFLITPLVKKIAFKLKVVDFPDERKVHDEPIPSLGGVAIFIGFLLGLILAIILFDKFSLELAGIILGGTIIFVLGVIDDIKDLTPKIKFIGQISASFVLVLFGVQIEFVGNPFGGLIDVGLWSIPLTVIWVVAFTNMINLIDGLDGLAAGVSSIAALALFFAAFQTGRYSVAFIALALIGSAIGFLFHNFHPASIFMGDSGSMFLGFILGSITAQGVMKSVAIVSLLVPLMIMGVPIFDTLLAILRRLRHRVPVSQADRAHIHHQLLHRGFTHRQTVIIIYIWCILLSTSALALNFATPAQRASIFIALAALSFFFAKFLGLFDWQKD
ncbi:MAG: undecaprenyl/decaprenyl-phosphate alpha-N-acetylglucosaminyl 1-phosphate transferase [Actinobacteria bacterium]|nr:undecaprenyl/decaprenyl-phosphate alpha-N-acetylglucosaminyl 1-phosphate transferase [Actinomycetota bacterium]